MSNNNVRLGMNLPTIDRVIMKSNQTKLPYRGVSDRKQYHLDNKSLEGMLKI
jgi:hypothetical protein